MTERIVSNYMKKTNWTVIKFAEYKKAITLVIAFFVV